MNIEVITKEKLTDYKHLMLSYIYEELDTYDDDLDCEYICLAATVPNQDGIIIPVSVLICLMEPFGDIAVLSIYTLPDYRRKGYASELLDKAGFIARRLFIFEDGEDEEDVNLKAIYRLRPELQEVFEAFLKKNHFVDFILLDEDDDPQVWAAMAEYNFYKLPEEKDPEDQTPAENENEDLAPEENGQEDLSPENNENKDQVQDVNDQEDQSPKKNENEDQTPEE